VKNGLWPSFFSFPLPFVWNSREERDGAFSFSCSLFHGDFGLARHGKEQSGRRLDLSFFLSLTRQEFREKVAFFFFPLPVHPRLEVSLPCPPLAREDGNDKATQAEFDHPFPPPSLLYLEADLLILVPRG